MKNTLVALVGFCLCSSTFAYDLIEESDLFFDAYTQCGGSVEDADTFKTMLNRMKFNYDVGAQSDVEVVNYSAYGLELENVATKKFCSIIVHEDCFSAYCD